MSAGILFENFDLVAEAPNGVQKLRELILDRAVRGKLVAFDLKDRPASELLKRIQAQREQAVQTCEIRKQEPLPSVGDGAPYEIPVGWEWTRLGNTGRIFNGNSVSESGKADLAKVKEGLPFVATKDVGYGRDTLNYENGLRVPFDDADFKVAHAGAVLICAEGGSAGRKIGVTDRDICFGNKLYANEVWSGIYNRYIFYVYQSAAFFREFSSRMTGIIGGIARSEFHLLLIPIPPEKEQRRIVAKLDQLMALCDELEEKQKKWNEARISFNTSALDHLLAAKGPKEFDAHWQRISTNFDLLYDKPGTVGKMRQAILQLAVQGKLVPQNPKDEPASALLEKIKAEKERLIKEKKIKKAEPLPPISEDEVPYELPKGWAWARISDIASHRLGKMLDAAKNKGDKYPYLRNLNVQWMRFNLDDVKKMRFEKEEIQEYELKVGDLLVCEGGEPGRCAIWSGEMELMLFQKAIHRVRPFGGIEPWFLLYNLYADAQSGQLASQFTGATIKHFTGQELARYVFGLPPLSEQRRILKRLKELFNVVDDLETNLTHAERASGELMEAVVGSLMRHE